MPFFYVWEFEMREVEYVKKEEIKVVDRARKLFTPEGLLSLSEDIRSNEIGLIHPLLIKDNGELITGERRYRVLCAMHENGENIRFAGKPIPTNCIPAIRVSGDFDLLDYLIAEAVENSSRENFTWQEKAALDLRIVTLQQMKINASKQPDKLSEEVIELADDEEGEDRESKASGAINHFLNLQKNPEKIQISREAIRAAVKEQKGMDSSENSLYIGTTRMTNSVKLAQAMEDPVLAEKLRKAPTMKEAEKILKVEERKIHQRAVAMETGRKLRSADRHTAIHGDCLVELKKLADASVDLCLTDPPYGINAHKFGVAKRDTGFHDYTDTPEEFEALMIPALKEVSRILKPAAHLYLFCDISKFLLLKQWVEESSQKDNPWTVQSFPLHWIKVNGSRCPHPGFTYRRTVEYILFAYRGGKQSNHQYDSHFEVSTKRTEVHGAAKEPEGLKVLLNNSAYMHDLVLDFCAGSGSIISACNELNMRSIAIEKDLTAYGRCIERIKAISGEKDLL